MLVECHSQARATTAMGVPQRRTPTPRGVSSTVRIRGLRTAYASTTPNSSSPAREAVP